MGERCRGTKREIWWEWVNKQQKYPSTACHNVATLNPEAWNSIQVYHLCGRSKSPHCWLAGCSWSGSWNLNPGTSLWDMRLRLASSISITMPNIRTRIVFFLRQPLYVYQITVLALPSVTCFFKNLKQCTLV